MSVEIRPIKKSDNEEVANVIRTVMPEFGAGGQGFAIHDAEVNDMFSAYSVPRAAYFVCADGGIVIGGAGVGPLTGGDADTCELKKMYLRPEGRGRGFGQQLLLRCLSEARQLGYRYCYIETFNTMMAAMKLYERRSEERRVGKAW